MDYALNALLKRIMVQQPTLEEIPQLEQLAFQHHIDVESAASSFELCRPR